jgi:hypothetical protein
MILGISESDAEKGGLLDFVLETVTDMIKNYCHIDTLPDGLHNVAVRMAAELWRAEGYGETGGTGGQRVTSVRRGDVTTSFGSAGGEYNENTGAGGASFLKNYTKQLQAYRQLGR